jgi:hypothetical protein
VPILPDPIFLDWIFFKSLLDTVLLSKANLSGEGLRCLTLRLVELGVPPFGSTFTFPELVLTSKIPFILENNSLLFF